MLCFGNRNEVAWILDGPSPAAASDAKGATGPKGTETTFAPKDDFSTFQWSDANVGTAQEQNASFRPSMEDTLYVNTKFGPRQDMVCVAVFDGHGGVAASELASTWIPRELELALEKAGAKPDFADVFRDVFKRSDDVYREKGIQYEGSTAVVCLFTRASTCWRLHVASCGDSKAAISRVGVAEFVCEPHTLDNEQEKERITASGGFVARGKVNGMLAVTRSLGDLFLKEVVTSEPTVSSYDLTSADDCLIVACDGMWDVIGKQTATETAAKAPTPKDAAERLVAHALEVRNQRVIVPFGRFDSSKANDCVVLQHGTTDNVTVAVVRFPWVK